MGRALLYSSWRPKPPTAAAPEAKQRRADIRSAGISGRGILVARRAGVQLRHVHREPARVEVSIRVTRPAVRPALGTVVRWVRHVRAEERLEPEVPEERVARNGLGAVAGIDELDLLGEL